MLQFPAFMRQYPSPPLIPSSVLLPLRSSAENDEILLAMEESELEDRVSWREIVLGKITRDGNPCTQCTLKQHEDKHVACAELNEIRKANSNLVVIGKATLDNKEDFDADAEEDDADNIEESDGDEFEQETG